jgi:hypothetical protein
MINSHDIDNRYLKSSALFDKPFELGEIGLDKIFSLCRAEFQGNRVRIDIEDWMPTYAYTPATLDKLNKRLGYSLNIPTTNDLQNPEWRNKPENQGLSFSSAGCMVWAMPEDGDAQFLALKRDPGAPNFPNHYTNPSGRCDRDPMRTAAEECAQEICATYKNRALIPFVDDLKTRNDLVDSKRVQMAEKREALESRGVDVDEALRSEPIWMRDIFFKADQPFRKEVVVFNRGIEVSRFSTLTRYDKKENCVDMNRVVAFPADSQESILRDFVAIDGESFGREVSLRSPQFLISQPLMPQMPPYLRNHLAP